MKKKFYYGWIVTIAAFFAIGLGTYFDINAFSIFLTPVVKGLNVSVAAFSTCATICSFTSAIGSFFTGRLIDRKGIRFTASIGGSLMVLAYLILGLSKNLPMFYFGYAVLGFTASIIGPMLTSTIATNWFVKYRGLVNGIISAGSGMFAFVASPVLASLIMSHGYSKTYLLSAIPIAVFVLLPSIVFFRDKPQDMGLLPDGATASSQDPTNSQPKVFGLTMGQAYRSRGFWLVTIGFIFYMFADLAIYLTYNANFQAKGFDPIIAALTVSIFGLASIPAKILFGYITDKISIKIATAIGFSCLIASALLTTTFNESTNVSLLYIFSVIFAFGHGCWPPLLMKYITYTCGSKYFSTIYGTSSMIFVLFSMFGPMFAGSIFDKYASYDNAYFIFAILVFMAFIILLFTKELDANFFEDN